MLDHTTHRGVGHLQSRGARPEVCNTQTAYSAAQLHTTPRFPLPLGRCRRFPKFKQNQSCCGLTIRLEVAVLMESILRVPVVMGTRLAKAVKAEVSLAYSDEFPVDELRKWLCDRLGVSDEAELCLTFSTDPAGEDKMDVAFGMLCLLLEGIGCPPRLSGRHTACTRSWHPTPSPGTPRPRGA